ncbi:MAG: YdcF family protein [Pseudomonadota bacterium]|nr:YdcF family protein [Pseudomonadota bacterium]
MRTLLRFLRRTVFRLAFLAMVVTGAWAAGLVWFAGTIPGAVDMKGIEATDAAVVLTGGRDRLSEGLRLLSEGKAGKLFVSGVHRDVTLRDLLRLQDPGAKAWTCCIVLGHAADSTLGNAGETARWMQAEGYTSLRLVTANYHMRRSMTEFREAVPEGISVLPYPVQPSNLSFEGWWKDQPTLRLVVNEYNKYLAALVRIYVLPRDQDEKNASVSVSDMTARAMETYRT